MKKLLLLITILLSSLTLMNCSEEEDSFTPIDSPIIGTWGAGEGEYASTLEFKTDGKYAEVGIWEMTGNFDVDGASVSMTATKVITEEGTISIPSESQETASYTFEVSNDTLYMTTTDAEGLDRTLVKK